VHLFSSSPMLQYGIIKHCRNEWDMVGHTYSANPDLGYQFENHKTIEAKASLFNVLCFTLQIF
jgi:hypothetical protein